ncbi:MAG: carboxyl transferase domain-containing protein [Chloroflexota bacterium]
MTSIVISLHVSLGDLVEAGQTLLVLEAMKVQTPIVAPNAGTVSRINVSPGSMVEEGTLLLEIREIQPPKDSPAEELPSQQGKLNANEPIPLEQVQSRLAKTLDSARQEAIAKRHRKGYRSARENLADLCDPDSFIEYGQLAVAAQRQRRDYEELQSATAADGVITGIGTINSKQMEYTRTQAAIVINDYSVLAGTQGYFHHQKLDRILAIAESQTLPVIMYTEGGGGRPGDTDITTASSSLNCQSFTTWARLSGVVPRIAVNNGYCFAGNAALFGAADITIATQTSWIGMAGPAMIEGGGLGTFKPTEIGPTDTQARNGSIDLVAQDEAHATHLAKQVLSYFQGPLSEWECADQEQLRHILPEDRRFVYNMREVITILADRETFLEVRSAYGGAIITGFMRIEGRPLGVLASDCNNLGGAIDVDAGEKAAHFIQLCNTFGMPLLSLCDTPGFMVGPQHEELGAVRRLSSLFVAGAKITVPLIAIILRKCYGLGAQALLGGSTMNPSYTVAWPSAEFGAMGLEGAVRLGFKKELEAEADPQARQALFEQLLAQQYARGQAVEVATLLEIDAVIDPADSRRVILAGLGH